MKYTVWRGRECLGHAELEPIRKPGRLRGVFTPTPAGEALGQIHQARPRHWPGQPTIQQRLRRAHETASLDSLPRAVASVERVLPDDAQRQPSMGVAPEDVLELRDAGGVIVPTDLLQLSDWPGARLPGPGIHIGPRWTVVVALSPDQSRAT